MATMTTEEIVAQRQREREAEAKYRETPYDLTREDVLSLSPSSLSEALAAGHLAALGYGQDKRRRR